jgi:hypothetical protein
MRVLKPISAGLLSIGWLVPFAIALNLVMEYSVRSRLLAFLGERGPGLSADIRFYANALCVLGALWLATVITGWTAHFMRRRA